MRLEKLRNILTEEGLDAILISQPENRRYLSGFTGSAGILLISHEKAVAATDFRYYEQVGHQAPAFELARIVTKFSDLLPELLGDLAVKRLGFESQHVTVDQLHEWSQAVRAVEWVPLKQTVERLRVVKEEGEIECMRRSAALTDAAFAHLMDIIKSGITEQEAAWEIEAHMRTHGAASLAFPAIVAAGSNGAMPHARPGTRPIQPGEPVVIDIGCVVDGYCSDMTRTICLGEPNPKYLEVWNIVLKAQQAAREGIRAGVTSAGAHALAAGIIEAAGYGDNFGHGLGHGVGLAIHEAPRASRLGEDTFEDGMILTIEPGIYLPGEFGVRIEDLVVIRDNGIETLTQTAKVPVVA